MSINDEYYFIGGSGEMNFIGHPKVCYASLVEMADSQGYSNQKGFIENPQMTYYRFGKGSPLRHRLSDYSFARCNTVVSKKIYNVLAPMNIHGVQFLPATVRGGWRKFKGQYYVHVINEYDVIDENKSKLERSSVGFIMHIDKLVLNEEVLAAIPLEERLIFGTKGYSVKKLYHKTIVDRVMAIKPKGIGFYKI